MAAEGFFSGVLEFDWDEWNREKNRVKHNVDPQECEEVFFNHPILGEIPESQEHFGEERYWALGKTNEGRRLTVIFTVRKQTIRVISARDMSRMERSKYEKGFKENTEA